MNKATPNKATQNKAMLQPVATAPDPREETAKCDPTNRCRPSRDHEGAADADELLPTGEIDDQLSKLGYASLGTLLTPEQCHSVRALYDQPELFRSRIDMQRYRFGRGEYQYFAYPLPPLIADLRARIYASLAQVANQWMAALRLPADFPAEHSRFLDTCHERGQIRPTPLLLRYREGDYNCLHQDLYGDVVFPFQVIIGLSRPGVDFDGGELLLIEQQPRAQSIGHALSLSQGEGVVITTRYRPVAGKRGYYRSNVRHGVSRIRSGERYTLGIIFHDAT